MCHAADTYSSIEQVRPALEVNIANIIKGDAEKKSSVILPIFIDVFYARLRY